MSRPSAEEQVLFLAKVQRLVTDAGAADTYRFALLLALADLSVEKGAGSTDALPITVAELAEKFIGYYWRQAAPYGHDQERLGILAQNPGKQAAVINHILAAQESGGGSLPRVMGHRPVWNTLLHDVKQVIKIMPLWKLQMVGGDEDAFLYPITGTGDDIVLFPGVASNFRQFYGLLCDFIQGAWLRHIRRIRENERTIGRAMDLREFLFGTERESLAPYHALLREIQGGSCFYCGDSVGKSAEVDHFVPWIRYSRELGHNFVLTDAVCNRKKGDRLAAENHLENWIERNTRHDTDMRLYFEAKGIPHDLAASRRICCWAYEQAELEGAHVWVTGDQLQPVGTRWRTVCWESG